MEIASTPIQGCFVVQPQLFRDDRGLFFESYHAKRFQQATGIQVDFVQDNISVSKKGVLRGLHYQKGAAAQAKLVNVLKGEVLDVVVDLRKDSASFGRYFGIRLSETNRKSLFVPKDMAHGFLALSEEVIFSYKCDAFYDATSEGGIIYNDPTINIDWDYPEEDLIISEKDLKLPTFKEVFDDISFGNGL
ncbi:dTDP-4-dehydrorhamnose 3,5-epimerase [Pseudozobellia thermophila]|uniref:dTDP-4-dehydrorhamnose 3,5-epimerase n=1 Tax=Pseudozobellia thermophila TaxID=192903 RepID=A0A1M6BL81_9FLAO|nr:dTDP-4-dehydrorhamnose 3,5-epimerase [Pseudozobellia thermophila]SHI49550.1 dTDP-4-dehydrorhamnose 3,5-epimerase [Pseudozobellia thermophila]